MARTYGSVTPPAELEPRALPAPRGPLTEWLFALLGGPLGDVGTPPRHLDDALYGEDAALALYALYELHYRGFDSVDEDWEWEPGLLAVRRRLETELLARLHDS